MRRPTHILRRILHALAPLAAAMCILLLSSNARAMVCPQEFGESDSQMSPLPVSLRLSSLDLPAETIGDPAPEPSQACGEFNDEQCQLGFPEGQPRDSREYQVRRPVAAHPPKHDSHTDQAGCQLVAARTQQSQGETFSSRVFRPPRAQ